MYWKNGQNKGAIVDNYKNVWKRKRKKLGKKKLVDLRKIKILRGRNKYNTTSKKNIVNAFQKYYMNQKENSLRYTYERF